jgi:DNA-binding NtrC family response regulator
MAGLKRLMIVDDEETLTFSLYQTFRIVSPDYEVDTAASGEEASEMLRRADYDLVITDISMPGMSGIELLVHIKSEYPATQVIIMTAYGSDEKKEEAIQNGAQYYIEKPFEIKEIKELVQRILL